MPVIWVTIGQGTCPTGGMIPWNNNETTGGTTGYYWNTITSIPTYTNCITNSSSIYYTNRIYYPIYVEDIVTPTQYYDLARGRIYICRERTEAENRRLAEEQRQREARLRVHERERTLAYQRSRELLLEHLTVEQRRTFEENGWFIVKGGQSGAHYRIRTGTYAGNVDILDSKSQRMAGLCCHCDDVPLHDHHLAQMIAIRWDEERFLRVANRR